MNINWQRPSKAELEAWSWSHLDYRVETDDWEWTNPNKFLVWKPLPKENDFEADKISQYTRFVEDWITPPWIKFW